MISFGLKKLAAENGMSVSSGIAYGAYHGYAAAFADGAGIKRITVSTSFPDAGKKTEFQQSLDKKALGREYRIQNINFSGNLIVIDFLDNPGTMKRIRAFADWFFPLLSRYGATGAEICTECGCQITSDGGWKLVDNGAAVHLHEGCAQRLQRQAEQQELEEQEQERGSYLSGLLGALLGGIVGAIPWALLLCFGYVAAIAGFLIGWLADKGYKLFHGKKGWPKVLALVLAAVVGVALGTFLSSVLEVGNLIRTGQLPGFTYGDIPMLFREVLLPNAEYMSIVKRNILLGLFCAFLGIFFFLARAVKDTKGFKMKDLK